MGAVHTLYRFQVTALLRWLTPNSVGESYDVAFETGDCRKIRVPGKRAWAFRGGLSQATCGTRVFPPKVPARPLSAEEWAQQFEQWADSFPEAPVIPDESLSRENLYPDHR